MKYFVILTLVALATACDDDDCPCPHSRPDIFVKTMQDVKWNKPYSFKFAVAGMKPLNESEVHLKKIVTKGHRHPEIVDTDFKISLRTLNDTEINDFLSIDHHHHHYKHVIVGEVETGRLRCKDQSHYWVQYGDRRHDAEEEDDNDCPHPDPKYRGVFYISVKWCKRPDPHPRPHGPPIFVKKFHKAALNESYSFKFGVAGMKPLKESEVHLKKVVKGHRHPELVDTDFKVTLRGLSEEEIKEWMDQENEKNPRPNPRRAYKHVIVGKVETGVLTCEDQSPYMVIYGDRRHDNDEEGEEDSLKHHPRPHPKPRGFFFILVEGCKRPHQD